MMHHLNRKACHAIHTSIPRGNDGNGFPLLRMLNRGLDTLFFAGHAGRDAEFSFGQVSDGGQIGRIPGNDATGTYRLFRARGTIEDVAWANTDYKELSRAIATVTPFRLIRV
jgi:hypothetical protein